MPRDGSGIYTTPVGTTAVPDTTIESAKYNNNVADVAADLNAPRPIVAGGTGANNAVDAAINLGVVSGKTAITYTDAEKAVARNNIAAAPLDALAYNGMQINGSMEVSQENGTTDVLVSNTSKNVIDNWRLHSGGVQTVGGQQVTSSAPGFNKVLLMYVSVVNNAPAANDHCFWSHYLEGYRVARLAWGTANASPITISFWVYSTKAGTFSGAVKSPAGARTYIFTYTISVAAVWEYKSIAVPGDIAGTWAKDNTAGMSVGLTMMMGTTYAGAPGSWLAADLWGTTATPNMTTGGSSFYVTGFTILPGTQAPTAAQSPLIMRPYDQELLTCQRYYEQSTSSPAYTANDNSYPLYVPATVVSGATYATPRFTAIKRTTPTVVTYPYTTPTNTGRSSNNSGVDQAALSASVSIITPKGFRITNGAAVDMNVTFNTVFVNWIADARL